MSMETVQKVLNGFLKVMATNDAISIYFPNHSTNEHLSHKF